MAQLSKTQSEMLNTAKVNGFVAIEYYYGTGSQGGKVSGGNRQANAALSLVRMGLLEVVSQTSNTICRNGFSAHVKGFRLRHVASVENV